MQNYLELAYLMMEQGKATTTVDGAYSKHYAQVDKATWDDILNNAYQAILPATITSYPPPEGELTYFDGYVPVGYVYDEHGAIIEVIPEHYFKDVEGAPDITCDKPEGCNDVYPTFEQFKKWSTNEYVQGDLDAYPVDPPRIDYEKFVIGATHIVGEATLWDAKTDIELNKRKADTAARMSELLNITTPTAEETEEFNEYLLFFGYAKQLNSEDYNMNAIVDAITTFGAIRAFTIYYTPPPLVLLDDSIGGFFCRNGFPRP